MILQKYICLVCSFFIAQCLTAQYVTGYEINGYEIDASQRATIVLNFNSAITDFSVSEKNPFYAISLLDVKALKIETLRPANKPYTLLVTEGGRKHNFLIVYKDSIDFSKQIQDFSDLDYLKAITDSLQRKSEQDHQVLQLQKNLYDSLYKAADVALADSDFNSALNIYKQLLSFPSIDAADSYYISQQINYLQKAIPSRDARNKQIREEEEHSRQVAYAIDMYNRAQDSVKTGNFNEALVNFTQFINFVDSTSLTSNEYDFEKLVNYSKKKAGTIQAYFDTLNAKKMRGDTLTHKPPDVKNLPSRIVIYYPNPKDPRLEAIYKKYPDIDFNRPPDNQLFDSIDLSQQIKLQSNDIKSSEPLYISEANSNGVRLSCDNLIFKDAKVYIKLMLDNASSSEFLTGNMLLVKKEAGSSIGILPVYVSGYPIILPNEQKVIVYVCKYKPIAQDGSLEFEVNDRLNKIRIRMTIPGSIYNREQQKFKQN